MVKIDKKKLREARIGIAGAGGLGSNIAVSLARIGVGNLVIVDYDRVEKSNLNRQYFFKNQIGQYKCEALKANILAIREDINIEIHKEKIRPDNILDFFADVDILVEALDEADQKAMLVREYLGKLRNKKLVGASGIAGYSSSNEIKTKRMSNNFYLVGDGKNTREEKENLFLAPRVSIAANHQANMVLRLILNEEDV